MLTWAHQASRWHDLGGEGPYQASLSEQYDMYIYIYVYVDKTLISCDHPHGSKKKQNVRYILYYILYKYIHLALKTMIVQNNIKHIYIYMYIYIYIYPIFIDK